MIQLIKHKSTLSVIPPPRNNLFNIFSTLLTLWHKTIFSEKFHWRLSVIKLLERSNVFIYWKIINGYIWVNYSLEVNNDDKKNSVFMWKKINIGQTKCESNHKFHIICDVNTKYFPVFLVYSKLHLKYNNIIWLENPQKM